jgi:hypothetical protein
MIKVRKKKIISKNIYLNATSITSKLQKASWMATVAKIISVLKISPFVGSTEISTLSPSLTTLRAYVLYYYY